MGGWLAGWMDGRWRKTKDKADRERGREGSLQNRVGRPVRVSLDTFPLYSGVFSAIWEAGTRGGAVPRRLGAPSYTQCVKQRVRLGGKPLARRQEGVSRRGRGCPWRPKGLTGTDEPLSDLPFIFSASPSTSLRWSRVFTTASWNSSFLGLLSSAHLPRGWPGTGCPRALPGWLRGAGDGIGEARGSGVGVGCPSTPHPRTEPRAHTPTWNSRAAWASEEIVFAA